ncbi:Amine oxidase, partial [Operophtera brumata]
VKMTDVIVIGLGAAGVAALRKLHDAGLQVLGLEAADRIGGRIKTVKFGENNVKDLDLLDVSNLYLNNNNYIQTNGERVPEDKGKSIIGALAEEVARADKKTTKSVAECLREAGRTNELLNKHPTLSKPFIEYYERLNRIGAQGDTRYSKSLRSLEEYWPYPSKKIPVQIELNKEVENINWNADQSNQLVQVKCKDGSVYTAKRVIITASVAVLKERHNQLFTPSLPTAKINTIKDLQLCLLGKIYVEFTKPWWPKSPSYFQILWRDEDKAKFTSEERWITDIYGLDSVASQPNSLLTWVYGGGVEQMERQSLEQVQAGLNKLFDLVLRKQFNVTPIKSIVSVLTEENGSGGAMELSEPLYQGDIPVVCFAGEATSHHRHWDVQGAVESGFREAKRLIKSLQSV